MQARQPRPKTACEKKKMKSGMGGEGHRCTAHGVEMSKSQNNCSLDSGRLREETNACIVASKDRATQNCPLGSGNEGPQSITNSLGKSGNKRQGLGSINESPSPFRRTRRGVG